MRQKILSILNIRKSESKYVFDLLPVQLFIGIATSFTNIIAFAFFIHEFSITQLPYAYLAVAAALVLVNIFYQKLEHHFSPIILLKHIITFSAFILIILWTGLRYYNEHLFTFLLFVWSIIFYMIAGYAFWGLVSLLFNVRESKRVFSIVGSGDIPAKLIGYLSAPFLMPLIGTNNLIWLAFASLAGGFILLTRVVHKKKWSRLIHHADKTDRHIDLPHDDKNITFFFQNPLILAISLLSLLSYNVFNLIDFTFVSQVKLKYESIQSLATFIAILLGLGRLIAFVMKLALTSRMIERLGIITCLFITPITLFVFCVVFLLGVNKPEYYVYVFGLMALLTEVLRSIIQEPVFFILFQPLKESLRLKGHIISKGYMLAPSLIIVGLSLAIFYKTGIQLTIPLTFKILILNLTLWGILIYFLRKAYLKTLHDSIRKGVFSSEDIHIHDQKTADILINKIKTGKENEIIFALKLMENASYSSINTLLEEQLHSQFQSVRMYSLERLEAGQALHRPLLHKLLVTENNPEVKQKIISLLCRHDKEFLGKLAKDLSDYDRGTRKVIIVNLLNQREFGNLLTAGNEMNTLIYSPDPEERILAIDIIGELKNIRFTDSIKILIRDNDLSVKRNAIIVACKLKIEELLPEITRLLDHPIEKYLAMQGFIHYGDDFFAHISKRSAEAESKYEDSFVKIAAKTKGNHSTAYLLSKLQEPIPEKNKLIHALWAKEFSPEEGKDKEKIQRVLDNHLAASTGKINYYHAFPSSDIYALMKSSVEGEIKNDLVTALKICALLYSRKEINRTIELIDSTQKKPAV
ncbi:MAG: hypothetical protein WDO19_12575 [Bacteroidota bacterium]